MLRTFQHEGRCWRRDRRDTSTQGALGICGSRATHSGFCSLGDTEQQIVRDDAEERYVSYAFLHQSRNQHGNLKVDLQNDFTTGDKRYPKNRQQTLHLLDKYSKTVVAKTTQSEGTSFVQGGSRGVSDDKKKESRTYDKKFWKDKPCFKSNKRKDTQ